MSLFPLGKALRRQELSSSLLISSTGRTAKVPTDYMRQALDSSEVPTLAHRSTESFRKTPRLLISTIRGVPITRTIKHLFCVCHECSEGTVCQQSGWHRPGLGPEPLQKGRIGCLHLIYREPATNTASRSSHLLPTQSSTVSSHLINLCSCAACCSLPSLGCGAQVARESCSIQGSSDVQLQSFPLAILPQVRNLDFR